MDFDIFHNTAQNNAQVHFRPMKSEPLKVSIFSATGDLDVQLFDFMFSSALSLGFSLKGTQ